MRTRTVSTESWPIRGGFAISRGTKQAAEVVVVTLSENGFSGRGECVPYARYGESISGVMAQIEALPVSLDRRELINACPPGAARNAVDCALWDLEAKQSGKPVWQLAGISPPAPCTTAYTISLGTPEAMASAAAAASDFPLLKVKLGGDRIVETVAGIRAATPDSALILDANEGWDLATLHAVGTPLADLRIAMIEQPLPADQDDCLEDIDYPIRLCADESCHGPDSLPRIAGRYDLINIKLDKTGGLTAALDLVHTARDVGLGIMVGCMVGTSLAMAPATLIAQFADYVDLDGPLLLERDRPAGLRYSSDGTLYPPERTFWG